MFYPDIRDEIRKKRQSLGMTQETLGALSGIKRSNIARIESKRCNPTLSTIEALCGALHLQLLIRDDIRIWLDGQEYYGTGCKRFFRWKYDAENEQLFLVFLHEGQTYQIPAPNVGQNKSDVRYYHAAADMEIALFLKELAIEQEVPRRVNDGMVRTDA